MRPIVDPEGAELSHLASACELKGKKVLEIGCGHGTLTIQYGEQARRVMGLDLLHSELVRAKGNQPEKAGNIFFIQGNAEKLPYKTASFDVALFASSL